MEKNRKKQFYIGSTNQSFFLPHCIREYLAMGGRRRGNDSDGNRHKHAKAFTGAGDDR